MSADLVPSGNGSSRELWEKRPAESFKAFQAFALFRDLGSERTLVKVAEALGKSTTLIQGWSSRHDWFERAEAYDLVVDARLREQRESDIERSLRTERGLALAIQRIGMDRLRGRGEPGEDGYVAALSPGELDARDALDFVVKGIQQRRLADGQPTDFMRGVLSLSPADGEKLIQRTVEALLPFIPDELQTRALQSLQEAFK